MADGLKPPKPVKNIPKDVLDVVTNKENRKSSIHHKSSTLNVVTNKENRKSSIHNKSSTLQRAEAAKAKELSQPSTTKINTHPTTSVPATNNDNSKEPSTSKILPSSQTSTDSSKEGQISKSNLPLSTGGALSTGGRQNKTTNEKSMLSKLTDQSFPPGSGNVYEPLSTESMDPADRVYTQCKNNSLSRAEPFCKPDKVARRPEFKDCLKRFGKPERIVIGVILAVLVIVTTVVFGIAVASLVMKGNLKCNQMTEMSPFPSHNETAITKQLPMDSPGYMTFLATCLYNEGQADMNHVHITTTATLHQTTSQHVYCRCTRVISATGNESRMEACVLQITRCQG